MKKRIIAILLSLSVFCFSFGLGNRRASAAPAAAGAIIAIGVLAWELIGVCTGMYDQTAAAIGEFIESGVEGFTNPDSPFQQNWREGWNSICDTVQGWFDNGNVEIVDGKIKLTYDQIQVLYSQLWSFAPKPGVNFETEYPSFFLDLEGFPIDFPIGALPNPPYLINNEDGESYALCYCSDDKIVFSDYFIILVDLPNNKQFSFYYVTPDFTPYSVSGGGGITSLDIFNDPSNCFTFESLSSAYIKWFIAPDRPALYSGSNCFVFSNGSLVYTPVSDVDLSGLKLGLVSTNRYYWEFLKSLTGHTVTEGATLDDLSKVIPTEYNPSLIFPVNPDLTRPLPNQINVSDVPGVTDLPLSDYMENIKTDIDVPSIITSKFPFCIPFDFIRFLGLLCSDPVAPVFRIPISTNPGNLGAWSGNQTVGEYLNPDDLLFEIDEEIVIDLSVIPLVQPVCYTCFIVGFIILLLHITPKMIQH